MRFCERGFTFIEAVITLLILSIVVTGSVMIAGKGLGGMNLKQDRQTAFRIAESLQDEVLALPLTSSLLAAGHVDTRYFDIQGKAVAIGTDPAALFKVTLTTTQESKAPTAIGGPVTQKKVAVEVIWDTKHGNPVSGITYPDKVSTSVWR